MKTGSQLTIEGMVDAAQELIDNERELRIKIAIAKRDVARFESELVGVRERLRLANEVVRIAKATTLRREVTIRERNLLRSVGLQVKAGEEFTDYYRDILLQMGMGQIETTATRLAKS
jgi:hypothetical protein